MAQREEESLIEDMRATIRGDRERAAARAAGQQPPAASVPEPDPAPAPPPAPPAEPAKGRFRRLLGR